jgi:oligoribonuclease
MTDEAPSILVWIDLEMTGLDPGQDVILEAVALVTDADLNEAAASAEFVVHQPEAVLTGMNEWCIEHHGKSGLTKASRESLLSMADVEEQLLAFVSAHAKAATVPLCGNSIHVDRAFLARQMPRLEAWFHYRNIDVSTLKELVGRWYPALPRFQKSEAHRALEDIRQSVAELRYYREQVFRAAGAA